MCIRDRGETILLNETLGAPSGRAMEKLFAKIDAEPLRKQVLSLNFGVRVAGFFASLSPRTLAWSASAAALAILLQAGLIAGIALKEQSAGGYETASAPSTDPCLLYTSDAADDLTRVDLGGRRIIKKK